MIEWITELLVELARRMIYSTWNTIQIAGKWLSKAIEFGGELIDKIF